MRKRVVEDVIKKDFLLNLLAPYHPMMKPGEKIIKLNLAYPSNKKDEYLTILYYIEEGGVKDS